MPGNQYTRTAKGWGDFCALREISFSSEKVISRKPKGGEGKKIDSPKTKRKKEDRGAKNKWEGLKI